MFLKGCELVEKRNILNQIRHNDMTLQELRFFSIYLAKINARDISTRKVKFKLEDFQKIMELGRINIDHLNRAADRLLQKIVAIPNEDGKPGFTKCQLFKRIKLYRDDTNLNQWYIEIDAHDDALPLMFDFKERYFTYDIGNILRLASRNQFRMYELLKQYQPIGMREISLEQLKDWLGIAVNEYQRWDRLKVDVIESCKKALKENTDIEYEYEKIKSGKKVVGVRFLIKKNKDYKSPLSLEEFLKEDKPAKQPKQPKREIKPTKEYKLDSNSSFTIDDLKAKAGQ